MTPPLLPHEREGVLDDLADLEVFQALLAPRGVRGIAVEDRYLDWELVRGSLRALLDAGTVPRHEPAVDVHPAAYVTWEYARGFRDGVLASEDRG